MRVFDERYLGPIAEITGLEAGPLQFATGVALATAIIGKTPVKTDLAYFLGMTENEMNALAKTSASLAWENKSFRQWLKDGVKPVDEALKPQELGYCLAAFLVSYGYYTEENVESIEHAQARRFLSGYFDVQTIRTKALFGGYLATLEYLWWITRGSGPIASQALRTFVQMRYGRRSNIAQQLQAFCGEGLYAASGEPYKEVISQLVKSYRERLADEGE